MKRVLITVGVVLGIALTSCNKDRVVTKCHTVSINGVYGFQDTTTHKLDYTGWILVETPDGWVERYSEELDNWDVDTDDSNLMSSYYPEVCYDSDETFYPNPRTNQ